MEPRQITCALIKYIEDFLAQDICYGVPNEYKLIKTPDGQDTDRTSKIVIAENYTEELETENPRPLILVTMGSIQNMTATMITPGSNIQIGTIPWSVLLGSDITLNCFARNADEARDVAWIIFSLIQKFNTDLRLKLNLHSISFPTCGAVAMIKSDVRPDLFAVPVQTNITWASTWTVSHTDLKEFNPVVTTVIKE